MRARLNSNFRLKDFLLFFLPVDSGWKIQFSDLLAHHSGYNHILLTRYGRTGLYCLLKVLSEQSTRRKVILPSYTCVVIANIVVEAGFEPVFLDNQKGKFQPDIAAYLEKIDEETCLVMPTHLFGIVEEVEFMYQQIKLKDDKVFVLQDCAHSFFAKDENSHPVSKWGDGALFGMNISKLVNSVHGGALALKNQILSEKVQLKLDEYKSSESSITKTRLYGIASTIALLPFFYAIVYWLDKRFQILGEVHYYDENSMGVPSDLNLGMNELEARIGVGSLLRFEERVGKRRLIAKEYFKAFSGYYHPQFQLPLEAVGNTWSHFPILVPKEKRFELKDRLEKELSLEIGILIEYAIAEMPAYKKRFNQNSLIALDNSERVLNLPLTYLEGIPDYNWRIKIDQIVEIIKHSL